MIFGKYEMKANKFGKLPFIVASVIIAIYINGCVSSLPNNPYNNAIPSITIQAPVSGDSVHLGQNKIYYTATPGIGSKGLSYYEVFLNNNFQKRYSQNKNGTNPNLYLDIDSTLLNTKISYYVIAYNLENKLKVSDVIKNILVVKYTKPPIAPQNITLERLTNSQILLFWSDSLHDADNFEIWRKDGANGTYRKIKTLNGDANNYRDINLSVYVVYFYKIRALNKFGYSPFSKEVSTNGVGGNAPGDFMAQALGATIVQLTWKDNSSNENGFKVQRRILETDQWETIKILSPNTEEYIDHGLTATTIYRYRVGAFTSNTISWSKEVIVKTFSVDIPGPSNLVATFNPNTNAVDITWSDNTNLENGTIIERRTGTMGNFVQIGATGPDESTFIDINIAGNNIYYYRAKHTTTEGFFTPYSNIDSAYVPVLPLKAPSNLEIVEFVAGSLYGLFWTNNAKDADGIELWRKDGAGGTYYRYQIFPPQTHAYNDQIQNSKIIYYYKLRAFKNNEYSKFSNEVNTTGSNGNIFRPTNLVATPVSGQVAVDLAWTDNSNNELGFYIERRMTGTNTFTQIAVVGPNIQYFRDRTYGLYRGSSYDYRVRAYNGQGYSSYSNIVQVTIPY